MVNKYVNELCPIEDDVFKTENEDVEQVQNESIQVNNIYEKRMKPKTVKSSGASSDDETSSSIIPIPDSLKQIKTQLKRNFSDAEESSEVESVNIFGGVEKLKGQIPTSLEQLRKKYILKNENSVALKMNSANMMLDDILNQTSFKTDTDKTFQTNYFRDQDFRVKGTHEIETSTEESVESPKQYISVNLASPIVQNHPENVNDFSKPCCKVHNLNTHQPGWGDNNYTEKGVPSTEIHSKPSIMNKVHNLLLKYNVQSLYKKVQLPNKSNKDFEHSNLSVIRQESPVNCGQEEIPSRVPGLLKQGYNQRSWNKYPKRMIFDLVASSDVASQSDISSFREEGGNVGKKCTCSVQRDCNCPEVIPNCICSECTCKQDEVNSESLRKSDILETPSIPPNTKLEETDRKSPHTPSPPENEKITESNPTSQKGNDERKPKEVVPFPKLCQDKKRHCYRERKLIERTDIYYFDHGNSAYYRTTDNHPVRYTECLVERTDEYATKFWAEFFGAIEIGVAFVISFILQLYRFFFTSIIRSLSVGLLQIFSDYFFKPLLAIIFNGLIQPCLILAYNIATSLRDLCLPISQTFGFFAKEVANIIRSCRIVEYNRDTCRQSSCHCGNKV